MQFLTSCIRVAMPRALVPIAPAIVLALGACGRDARSAASSGAQPARAPLRIETAHGVVSKLEPAPVRVVPANTAAAEFVCALLGAERVAALPEQVDAYSFRTFKERGFENVPRFARYEGEALIVHAPDLVVTHEWQSADTTEVLRSHGTPVLVLRSARDYADIRFIITELGRILSVEARSSEVAAELDRRVARLAAGAAPRAKWRALIYTNDGSGGWTAGAETTGDTLIRLAGMQNAASDAGLRGHVGLDFERLLTMDPDVIVASRPARDERGSATEATLRSVPALQGLKALASSRIAKLSSALLSSDSLSLVDAAEELAAEVDVWLVLEAKSRGESAR